MAVIEVIAERPFQLDGRYIGRGDRIAVTERQATLLKSRRYARISVPEHHAVVTSEQAAVILDPVEHSPPAESPATGRRRRGRRARRSDATESA